MNAKNGRLWHTQNGIRMPVQCLTGEERERLSQFPEQIEEEDITAFFTLSASEMKEIHISNGENKINWDTLSSFVHFDIWRA